MFQWKSLIKSNYFRKQSDSKLFLKCNSFDIPEIRKKFIKKFLKLIIINSEPVPPSLLKQLVNKFPSTRILVYYGLTEASRSSFIEFSNKTVIIGIYLCSLAMISIQPLRLW